MTHMQSPFSSQSEITQYANAYLESKEPDGKTGKEADELARQAGEAIKNGQRTKDNLRIIFHWKHARSRFYSELEENFESNSPECVASALNEACKTECNKEAVAALIKLNGVQVPTASAMLANIYPDRFTVIDRLALRALGVYNSEIAFYLLYNDECVKIAKQVDVPLRTLDRALWGYGSKRQAQPNRKCKNKS